METVHEAVAPSWGPSEETEANADLNFPDTVIEREMPLWKKGRLLVEVRLVCETTCFEWG